MDDPDINLFLESLDTSPQLQFTHAAVSGQLQIVKRLVANGADVNAPLDETTGTTPLHLSSCSGRTELLEFLLRKGAKVNATAINGETALHVAAFSGHAGVVSILLQYGADFKLTKEEGCTPLMNAADNGHTDVVKRLISKGASVNTSMIDGVNALLLASTRGHIDTVGILIANGANVNVSADNGFTPLMTATQLGHPSIVQKLVEEGAKVNASNNDGHTALLIAACNGSLEMVKYLVEKAGANILHVDRQGSTAARWASQNGHQAIVEYLANRRKNTQNPSGSTAAKLEYKFGDDPVSLEYLLNMMYSGSSSSSGVNHDLLVAAAMKGRMATAQKLVTSLGADPNHRDWHTNLTAEDTAHMEGHGDVAWFLNKLTEGRNRQSGSRPEMVSCKANYGHSNLIEMKNEIANTGLVDFNLDGGVFDFHFQDENGMTLLHTAVKKKQPKEITRLLERGALATALTYDGITPLDLARGKYPIAEAYIQMHLQKFTTNELKSSSEKCHYYIVMLSLILECISISSRHKDDDSKAEKERQEVLKKVSYLLALGVPLEPPGNYHTHALHLAITSNCKPILTLFLAAGASLYATHNGLGPVEVAWLTPDVTTWIAITVTRAVMNQLKSEVKGLNFRTVIDWMLIFGIIDLISQLDGETPWRAKFSMPDKYLNALLGAACEQGATLITWWVWRAGGCCLFQQKKGREDTSPSGLGWKTLSNCCSLNAIHGSKCFPSRQ